MHATKIACKSCKQSHCLHHNSRRKVRRIQEKVNREVFFVCTCKFLEEMVKEICADQYFYLKFGTYQMFYIRLQAIPGGEAFPQVPAPLQSIQGRTKGAM